MLSNVDILREIEKGNIVIKDFNHARLGTNSYDLSLGETFFEVVYDKLNQPVYVGPKVYLRGQKILVPVGGTLLGHTADHIETHHDIVGVLWEPSTKAREGFSICHNAGLGDCGFANKWTLEISSFVRLGQPTLTPGDRIAQIVFFRTESPPDFTYSGQYNKHDCEWPYCMIPKDHRNKVVRQHSKLLTMDSERIVSYA